MTRRCKAHRRDGSPCQRWAVAGAAVCPAHGGASPQVRRRIERDQAEVEAAAAVVRLGGRRDIHPAEALLELTQRKAMECEYWRAKVTELEEASLTYGVTQVKSGGANRGITEEARPAVELQLLHKAEAQLADFAAAALRAGNDERMVTIVEGIATQFRAVIDAVLTDSRLGIEADTELRDAVIADALRAQIDV